MTRTTKHNRFARSPGLKPRLVRIVGHYGEPWWGVVLARKSKAGNYKVVVLARAASTPRVQMVHESLVRPADKLAALPLLDAFVALGSLTAGERRHIILERDRLTRATRCPKRRDVTKIAPGKCDRTARPWKNIGAGVETISRMRALGELRREDHTRRNRWV